MKNHSYNLHTLICGIFCPHSVDVARYAALIRTKSPTNYDAHLAESIFQTRSNPKTGEGRSDIVLEDPDNDRVFIFELKRTKAESDMEKACLAALNQIQDKHYDDEYIDSYDEIVHYGVTFYKKRCLVKMEE